jgi:hypothetical protein
MNSPTQPPIAFFGYIVNVVVGIENTGWILKFKSLKIKNYLLCTNHTKGILHVTLG